MTPEAETLRTPSVNASIVAAAFAFLVFCLIAISVVMGWIGPAPVQAPIPKIVPQAPRVVQGAGELGLEPGESLVPPPAAPSVVPSPSPPTPPARVEGPRPPLLMPPYGRPATPPGPLTSEEKRARRAQPRDEEPSAPRRELPQRRYAETPHPTDPTDPWPQPAVCGTCGTVHSITVYPDLYEVRVRFDDGSRRTMRYQKPPRWRVGDRVRLDNGRLVRD